MKKLLAAVFLAAIIGFLAAQYSGNSSPSPKKSSVIVSPTPTQAPGKKSLSIFVPYWTLGSRPDPLLDNYDYLIYFGVPADKNGLETSDPGYTSIAKFNKLTEGRRKFLAITMINSTANSDILNDQKSQQKIISESIALAKNDDFNGIVFDLELSSIDFAPTTKKVTDFYTSFAKASHEESLPFYVTLYGDTYYRVRAYDVKAIAQAADQVLVMAYDFHKAHGNPGPNFPLTGKEVYGYDFESMIADFESDVPVDKLTIIFGMFGYDWPVDSSKESTDMGTSRSTLEIENTFIKFCKFSNCKVTRHTNSQEQEVDYTDNGVDHVIWFEDAESMKAKQKFLQQKGIYAFSLWAYSYF